MPFSAAFSWRFMSVGVVVAKCIVGSCSGLYRVVVAEESLHVRRIEDQAVKRRIFVGQLATVDTIGYVRWMKIVSFDVYLTPKYSFPVGDVCDLRSFRYMKTQHRGEDIRVIPDIRRQDQIRRSDAVRSLAAGWRTFFGLGEERQLPMRH